MASILQEFTFANLKEHIRQLDQYAAFAEFLGSFLFMFFGGACVANRCLTFARMLRCIMF